MNKLMTLIFTLCGVSLLFFLLAGVVTLPTYLLWNWLAPTFGLPTLTIWECLGLACLCHILFAPKSNSFKGIQKNIKKVTEKDILND